MSMTCQPEDFNSPLYNSASLQAKISDIDVYKDGLAAPSIIFHHCRNFLDKEKIWNLRDPDEFYAGEDPEFQSKSLMSRRVHQDFYRPYIFVASGQEIVDVGNLLAHAMQAGYFRPRTYIPGEMDHRGISSYKAIAFLIEMNQGTQRQLRDSYLQRDKASFHLYSGVQEKTFVGVLDRERWTLFRTELVNVFQNNPIARYCLGERLVQKK